MGMLASYLRLRQLDFRNCANGTLLPLTVLEVLCDDDQRANRENFFLSCRRTGQS